jgi:hypothetical protein
MSPANRRAAQPAFERHAGDVGDRQSGEHQGDGARPLVRRDEIGGHHHANPEKRSVRESGDHAGDHEQGIVRRDRRKEIAEDENGEHHEKHQLAGQLACGNRQKRTLLGAS